jgi:hypothetical protein
VLSPSHCSQWNYLRCPHNASRVLQDTSLAVIASDMTPPPRRRAAPGAPLSSFFWEKGVRRYNAFAVPLANDELSATCLLSSNKPLNSVDAGSVNGQIIPQSEAISGLLATERLQQTRDYKCQHRLLGALLRGRRLTWRIVEILPLSMRSCVDSCSQLVRSPPPCPPANAEMFTRKRQK